MSDATEVVKDVVHQVIERVDALAVKLGIAGAQIWTFTVHAKVIEAKRDLWNAASGLLLVLLVWGWALHVATMKLPHISEKEYSSSQMTSFLDSQGRQACCVLSQATPVEKDEGLSDAGQLLVGSGIVTALFGIFIACMSVSGIIDAIADSQKTEYSAFEDLMIDLRG